MQNAAVPSVPSYELLLESYVAYLVGERTLSKNTAELYRWRNDYFLRSAGVHPFDVTTGSLREHMLATCPRPATKESARCAFRSFYGFLVDEGYREDNPALALRRAKIADSLPKYLSPEEAAALDEAAYWEGLRSWSLCRLYLYLGLRATEGCHLAWRWPTRAEDPNALCSGVVDLREGWILVRGKGAKERQLPITPEVADPLRRLRKHPDHDLWLFPKPTGDKSKPVAITTVRGMVKRWAKAAGIDPTRVTIHVLRHTFATQFLSNGGGLAYVQNALGHADLKMTLRYARVKKDDLRREMRRRVKYSKGGSAT